jgi:hypothetical protein
LSLSRYVALARVEARVISETFGGERILKRYNVNPLVVTTMQFASARTSAEHRLALKRSQFTPVVTLN